MRVAVILVHYSNLPALKRSLRSLTAVTSSHELIPVVVGNGTPENDLLGLQRDFQHIQTLQLRENTGFTGGNNTGMRYALDTIKADVVVLLNDDATVAPDFLDPLIAALKPKNVAAAVPKIYFTAGNEFHTGYQENELGRVLWYAGGNIDWREVTAWHRGVDEVDRGQLDKGGSTAFGTGCCLAIKAEVLRRYGLLDDRFFLYWEDVDLSLRWQKHGLEIRYTPESTVWHENSSSSGSGSDLHVYYQLRNRFLIGWRYAPLRTKLFLLKRIWVLGRHGSSPQQSAILDAITGHYGIRHSLHSARH